MDGKSNNIYNRDDFDEWFHGDHIWIGFVVSQINISCSSFIKCILCKSILFNINSLDHSPQSYFVQYCSGYLIFNLTANIQIYFLRRLTNRFSQGFTLAALGLSVWHTRARANVSTSHHFLELHLNLFA